MVDGNDDPSSKPKKSESPPQLKKSRTVITTTASDDAEPTTPIFPGPLFPAVRRTSTLPPTSRQWPPPDRPASFSSSSSFNAPADHRDFSDRDWVFPSFVVPQNTSKRGKKLPSSSSDSRAAHANKLVDAPRRIASQPPPAALVPKPEAERQKLKVVPNLTSASSASESTRPSSRRTAEFKRSLLLVVVKPFYSKTVSKFSAQLLNFLILLSKFIDSSPRF